MKKNDYAKEGIDFKRLRLFFRKRIWIVVLMAVIGGGLGALTYQVVRALNMPIQYQAVSKLYITFNEDKNGDVYQYYNGYTWNDLLHSDLVVGCILGYLPDKYKKEDVSEATEASILSDVRLLTVTVTGEDEKTVREIQSAVQTGLAAYATINYELQGITTIHSIAPKRILWEDKTTSSMIAGAVLFGVITLMGYGIAFAIDDAIYVQSDLEKRYSYKALGVMPRSQKGLQPYLQELKANIFHELKDARNLLFIDIDDHCDLRALDLEKILNWQEAGNLEGVDSVSGELVWHVKEEDDADELFSLDEEKEWTIIPVNSEKVDMDVCKKIESLGGAIILVPFGSASAPRKLERIISLMKNQNLNIFGIVISEADEGYLTGYYA